MQQYESVIILTPLLSEEAGKEVFTKFSKILKDNGAEIIQEDNWGLKKLAYPIQKKTTGYYHLIELAFYLLVPCCIRKPMNPKNNFIPFLTFSILQNCKEKN